PVDHDFEGRPRALLLGLAGRAFGHRVEVIAGGEGAAGAGQHQHANNGIGFDAVEQPHQRPEVLRLQPVQVSRAIEPDGGTRVLDGEDGGAGLLGGRSGGRGRGGPLHYLFSSSRRLASASMVSASSGWRAINRRKSTRSSTRSFDSRVVVTLAPRRL